MDLHKAIGRAVGIVASGLILSACGTTQMNMINVQNSTAKTLGLGSSDEITIDNIQYGQKNALGGQEVKYDATTGIGHYTVGPGGIGAGGFRVGSRTAAG